MLTRLRSIAALFMLCVPVTAWAQQATTITVGSNKGAPGSEVSVDLTVKGAEAASSKTAVIRIQFPKSGLSFIRTESAVPGVTVDSKVLDDAKPDTGVVEVTIGLASDSALKALPDQSVGSAVFVIANDAKPETKIPVTAEAKAPITVSNGEVTVIPSLVFSCFFYMH